MAIIGFIALLFIGAYMTLAGGYFLWLVLVFSGQWWERVICAVIVTGGVLILWLAVKNGPISVSVAA